MPKSSPKIALVHDYLVDYGGAERVVEALHEIYPDAPLYVAFVDKKALGIHWVKFKDWDIRQTWIHSIPFHKKFFSPLRILAPSAFADLDLSEYDIVISSSNAYFAKAVKVRKDAVHICYCHTPPRSLYGYITMTDWKKNPVIKLFGTLINHYCRVEDQRVAQNVTAFIANSHEVQDRITKFYRRDSTVIYPPVNVPAKLPVRAKAAAEYYVYVSRLGFAKHPELAVAACNMLGLQLEVAGRGKMETQLKQIAGETIEFLGAASDDVLARIYTDAAALIYPVEDEDFGIVPVEAMGYGVPVIAHRSGGPRETVMEGETGIFFDELNVEALVVALKKFQKVKAGFAANRQRIHAHALKFSKERFQREMKEFVEVVVATRHTVAKTPKE